MSAVIEPKEVCEINAIENNSDFKDYLNSNPSGFRIVSSEYPDCEGTVLYSDTGNILNG